MKQKFITLKIVLSVIWGTFACSCSSDIDMVKNGTLNGYEQTTIGKAFDSSLGDSKWESFETAKGVKVVQASGWFGRTKYTTFKELYDYCFRPETKKVIIQFQLLANSNSFEISYCGIGEDGINCDNIIRYIYNAEISYEQMKENCSFLKKNIAKTTGEYKSKNYDLIDFPLFHDKWMRYFGTYNKEKNMNICPPGWHIPNTSEFNSLLEREINWAEILHFNRFSIHNHLLGDTNPYAYCLTNNSALDYCTVLCREGKTEEKDPDADCKDKDGNWICE